MRFLNKMSTSKSKIILKKKNLAIREMRTRLEYMAMSNAWLKNLVGPIKFGQRRGRPSKKSYVDELMMRQVNQRPIDEHNETKEEVYMQEEKTNIEPIRQQVVETKPAMRAPLGAE